MSICDPDSLACKTVTNVILNSEYVVLDDGITMVPMTQDITKAIDFIWRTKA